jgi:transcriptional regulator with XRE-family HTH domain
MSIWDETTAMNEKRRQRHETFTALRNWRLTKVKPSTLAKAGELLGVSESQMSRYENGWRRVPPEKVLHYEAITDIPREELRPDLYGPPLRGRRGAKVS